MQEELERELLALGIKKFSSCWRAIEFAFDAQFQLKQAGMCKTASPSFDAWMVNATSSLQYAYEYALKAVQEKQSMSTS